MKRSLILAAIVLIPGAAGLLPTIAALPAAAQSAVSERTATFAVENMTCALCPLTVRKAMAAVDGVRSVEIDYAGKTARVVFEPSVTNPDAIAAASTNAGYPATARIGGAET